MRDRLASTSKSKKILSCMLQKHYLELCGWFQEKGLSSSLYTIDASIRTFHHLMKNWSVNFCFLFFVFIPPFFCCRSQLVWLQLGSQGCTRLLCCMLFTLHSISITIAFSSSAFKWHFVMIRSFFWSPFFLSFSFLTFTESGLLLFSRIPPLFLSHSWLDWIDFLNTQGTYPKVRWAYREACCHRKFSLMLAPALQFLSFSVINCPTDCACNLERWIWM